MNRKRSVIALVLVVAVVIGATLWARTSTTETRAGGTTRAATTVDNTFAATGAVSFSSTLGVTGATSLATVTATGEAQLAGLVQGGSVTVITGSATTSPTAAQVCDSSVIAWTPSAASADLTLPSAATLYADCLGSTGKSKTLLFRNLSVAASTTEVLAGASSTLVGPGTGDDIVDGANEARLRFTRYSDTELVVEVEELTAAD